MISTKRVGEGGGGMAATAATSGAGVAAITAVAADTLLSDTTVADAPGTMCTISTLAGPCTTGQAIAGAVMDIATAGAGMAKPFNSLGAVGVSANTLDAASVSVAQVRIRSAIGLM